MTDDLRTFGAAAATAKAPGAVPAQTESTVAFEELCATTAPDCLNCPSCHHSLAAPTGSEARVQCDKCGHSFRLERVRQGGAIEAIRVIGRFQLESRVGHGSFGAVWRRATPSSTGSSR